MEPFPAILVSIVRANPGHGAMYVIIKQAHAYLEETLRRAFAGQENVRVVVDRRRGERRTTRGSVAVERRRADRRRPREHLVEVIVTEGFFGASQVHPSGG